MLNLPKLGLGTWGLGGKFERNESNIQASSNIIKFGLDQEVKLIDTAEIYGAGLTEEIIGNVISGYDRKKIFLVSKVWKTNLHYNDVISACKRSLFRLKTDYLDLYLIHWPSDNVPLEETLSAMEELATLGLIRNIGVSNFSVELLKRAQNLLKVFPLAVNQIEYNLTQKTAAIDIIPYCFEQGIKIMAYRPLDRGNLQLVFSPLIKDLIIKYKKTATQIALNWIINQNITAIPKTISREHLKENIGALGWSLGPEDIDLLNRAKFE